MDEQTLKLQEELQELKEDFEEHQHSGNLTNRIGGLDIEPDDEKYLYGVEVKTRKTWVDGRPIYRQVIDFGSLPNTTGKAVAFGADLPLDELGEIVSVMPMTRDTSTTPPQVWLIGTNETWGVNNSATTSYVICITTYDATGKDGVVIVEYTRTNQT